MQPLPLRAALRSGSARPMTNPVTRPAITIRPGVHAARQDVFSWRTVGGEAALLRLERVLGLGHLLDQLFEAHGCR